MGFEPERVDALAGAAIRHVPAEDRIDLVVIGKRLKPEIDANIRTLMGNTTCTMSDRAMLAEDGARVDESDAIEEMPIE